MATCKLCKKRVKKSTELFTKDGDVIASLCLEECWPFIEEMLAGKFSMTKLQNGNIEISRLEE